MKTYVWSTVRDRASKRFADMPGEKLETEIMSVFARRPAQVIDVIERVVHDVDAGKVRAGWPVVMAILRRQESTDLVATDERDREVRVRAAESWIVNAGAHFDREAEVLAELFDRPGILSHWHDDEALQADMIAMWEERRKSC